MKATGLNEDLANEVLRIKDNLVMYPDERQKQKPCLAIIKGDTPSDKPATATEWLNEVIIGRGMSTSYVPVFPKKVETKPEDEREKLTAEQIRTLKSLSYKSKPMNQPMVSLAA